MTLELLIHFESLPDGTPAWWAESDQLPGFAAQATSLRELLPVASAAAREMAAERGIEVADVTTRLAEDEPATIGDKVEYGGAADEPSTEGSARSVIGDLAAV